MGRESFSKTGVCNAKGIGGTKAWKQDQSVCLDNRNRNVRMEQDQRETGDKEEYLGRVFGDERARGSEKTIIHSHMASNDFLTWQMQEILV